MPTHVEVTEEELENVAPESTRTIDIKEFVPKVDIDSRLSFALIIFAPMGRLGMTHWVPFKWSVFCPSMAQSIPVARQVVSVLPKRFANKVNCAAPTQPS